VADDKTEYFLLHILFYHLTCMRWYLVKYILTDLAQADLFM